MGNRIGTCYATLESRRQDGGESMAEDQNRHEATQEAETAGKQDISLDDLNYEDYLKLTNPTLSDAEIETMVRKENRYTWIVRFELLALVLFVIVILFVIFLT
jgi:hypothetical protein